MLKKQVPSFKSQVIDYTLPVKPEEVMDTLFLEPPEEISARAQIRLTETLQTTKQEALLYGHLEHPTVASLFLAIRKEKVVAVNFGIDEDAFIRQIEKLFGASLYFAPEETRPALQQIRTYLDGQRTSFDLPTDISVLTTFQQQVLQTTLQIPRGKIATYLEIARKIGKPKAVRAVGQALGHNPIPIVIPCHRVIASNGLLGGYSGGGGLETKARLLQLEGALSL